MRVELYGCQGDEQGSSYNTWFSLTSFDADAVKVFEQRFQQF